MAFGLKHRSRRIRTYTSGNLFDLICEYYTSIGEISKNNKVTEVDEMPHGDACLVYFTGRGCKIVTTKVLKIYKLKKLIKKLNE